MTREGGKASRDSKEKIFVFETEFSRCFFLPLEELTGLLSELHVWWENPTLCGLFTFSIAKKGNRGHFAGGCSWSGA